LEYNCQYCQNDPGIKKELGCEEPKQVVVWETEDYDFYSCPLSFISPAHWEWYSEYAYNKEFMKGPDYNGQSALWLEAWFYYISNYNNFVRERMKKSANKQDKTTDALAALRAGKQNV
jgi:hypothetical protein